MRSMVCASMMAIIFRLGGGHDQKAAQTAAPMAGMLAPAA
jgi:hypothetical protein